VAFVFVIEVSHSAVTSGFLQAAAASIKHVVESGSLPGPQRQFGVITFDSAVHFYDLSPKLQLPQMYVMPDLEEPFQPLSSVLFSSAESESLLATLMDSLPELFADTKTNASCMGSAIRAAARAMAGTCGKIVVCSRNMPNLGELSVISSRSSPDLLNHEREVELLRPASEEYPNFAAELARESISLDFFVAPRQSLDLASMAPLATRTGGGVWLYREFQVQVDGQRLMRDMLQSLERCTAWQARMQVFVSSGWSVSRVYGNASISGSSLLTPSCHAEQNFAVLVDMDDGAKSHGQAFYIQAATWYTNSCFERRLRVHTYAMPCHTWFADVVSAIDARVTATLLTHAAMERAVTAGLQQARAELKTVARHAASAQNMSAMWTRKVQHFTEAPLQLVLLYILGILKSRAFAVTEKVLADDRIHRWAWLAAASTDHKIAYFCPRLLALPRPEELHDSIVSAAPLRLTSTSLPQDGMCLMEDGQSMTVWVGNALAPETLRELLGITSDVLCSHVVEAALRKPSTPLARRIADVIRRVCSERNSPSMEVHVIFAGEPAELRFLDSLIEDRTQGMQMTYAEFVQSLGSTL